MPAKSRSQQRLFGMVRAAQKGELEAPSPKVSQIAATTSVSSVKKFAKTKHKGLPEKKMKESFTIVEKFKSQYGKPGKMSQSSERKSLGRRSSTKDGSKPSGYESKKEFRDKSMPLRKFRDRFQSEALRSSTLSSRKAMKRIEKNEKDNKEQDMRMKHGKSWKDYRRDSGQKPLRKGEVRRYDKAKGKYVSNMPEGIDDDIRAKNDAHKHMTTQEKKNLEKKSAEGRGAELLNRLLRGV